MSQANPYAPTIETGPPSGGGQSPGIGGSVGGSARGGPASIGGGLSAAIGSPADSHCAAGLALGAVVVLILLWQSKFRFSMTVGGR